MLLFFFLMIRRPPRSTPFPTRRSSDLEPCSYVTKRCYVVTRPRNNVSPRCYKAISLCNNADRKSTRLNSSHLVISYAVFCLKKKINDETDTWHATYAHRAVKLQFTSYA